MFGEILLMILHALTYPLSLFNQLLSVTGTTSFYIGMFTVYTIIRLLIIPVVGQSVNLATRPDAGSAEERTSED